MEEGLQQRLQGCVEKLFPSSDLSGHQSQGGSEAANRASALALARVIASAANTLTSAELEGALTELAGMSGLPLAKTNVDEIVQQIR